ncbi:MAG: prefoldin subunit alpha [Candidatus Heimdallarchaeaceae archaeon]
MSNKSSPQIGQEELSKLLYSAQQLEQQASQYQKQLEILNGYISDINSAEQVLNEMKNLKQTKKILVPIGAGNFVYASIEKTSEVISSLGAGVHAEISITEALNNIIKRKTEINNQISQTQANYNQVIERLKEIDRLVKSIQQS